MDRIVTLVSRNAVSNSAKIALVSDIASVTCCTAARASVTACETPGASGIETPAGGRTIFSDCAVAIAGAWRAALSIKSATSSTMCAKSFAISGAVAAEPSLRRSRARPSRGRAWIAVSHGYRLHTLGITMIGTIASLPDLARSKKREPTDSGAK